METTEAEILSTSAPVEAAAGEIDRTIRLVSYAQLITISIIGSIGNSVVLYVYSQKKDKQTANIFILSLAASDMIACTLVIPMTLYMELADFRTHLIVCKLYYLVNASGIPFSCMLMSAIAVDRYFCICRPFLRAITLPRARAIVLSLGGLALSLGVTTAAFCSGVVAQFGPNGTWQYASQGQCKEINDIKKLNSSALHVSDASLAFFHVFQRVHVSLFGICISLVVALYICIYRSVLTMRRKRRELKGHQRLNPGRGDEAAPAASTPAAEQADHHAAASTAVDNEAAQIVAEHQQHLQHEPSHLPMKKRRRSVLPSRDSDAMQNLKTAAMLFVVAVVFSCTFVPAALMIVGLAPFSLLIFYLYYMAHATNPIIYCFMNQNFRDDLRRIFCRQNGRRSGGGGGGGGGGAAMGSSAVGQRMALTHSTM